jgi:hypothetical protein
MDFPETKRLNLMSIEKNGFVVVIKPHFSTKKPEWHLTWEGAPFTLLLDTGCKSMWTSFGIKQCMRFADNKFTDVWNGSYAIDAIIFDSIADKKAHQIKLVTVLDWMRDAVVRDLVKCGELSAPTADVVVPCIYKKRFVRNEAKEIVKVGGLPQVDDSKSPSLSMKVPWKSKGKYVQGKDVANDDRIHTTEFLTLDKKPILDPYVALLNAHCGVIPQLAFSTINCVGGKYFVKFRITSCYLKIYEKSSSDNHDAVNLDMYKDDEPDYN